MSLVKQTDSSQACVLCVFSTPILLLCTGRMSPANVDRGSHSLGTVYRKIPPIGRGFSLKIRAYCASLKCLLLTLECLYCVRLVPTSVQPTDLGTSKELYKELYPPGTS